MSEPNHFAFNLRDMVDAEIAVGPDPIPVRVTINGKKVRVGEGRINPDTMIFTTKLDDGEDNPNAGIFWDMIKSPPSGFSGNTGFVSVSEVTILDDDIPLRLARAGRKATDATSTNDVVGEEAGVEQADDTSEDEPDDREIDGHSPTPKFHNHD